MEPGKIVGYYVIRNGDEELAWFRDLASAMKYAHEHDAVTHPDYNVGKWWRDDYKRDPGQ